MAVDKVLVRQLRAANTDAFRVLFEQYAPRVYEFAYGFLKQRTQAEQVVRRVFVAIWERRWTLEEELSLNGYLFTLAYHQVLMTFRELHSVCRSREILQRLTTRSGSMGEERSLLEEWEYTYVQAIKCLPPRQRKIYQMTCQEGMSPAVIAQEMKLPESVVSDDLDKAICLISKNFE